jgi:hypothetical protein
MALGALDSDYRNWTMEQAVRILSDSPWMSRETSTRVVGGIGSGVQGEKEIYNTYFVRFLSALPIRQAFVRIRQLQLGYKDLDAAHKKEIDQQLQGILDLDVDHWIVVAVAFRSNNPREQSRVERFFESETMETIKTRAFLSTEHFTRVEVIAYFPPNEPSVGAKFVFPRHIDGTPIVQPDDKEVVFEFDTPGSGRELRARFEVADMIVNGELQI